MFSYDRLTSIFRLFSRKYAKAKRCTKNATFVLCKDTPQLRDEVNFIYDRFNPFCVNLSDPPRKSGPRRPAKASTVPFIRRSNSISSAAQSVTAKLLSFAVPFFLICWAHRRLWIEKDCHIIAKKTEIIIKFWGICFCREFFDRKVFWSRIRTSLGSFTGCIYSIDHEKPEVEYFAVE